MASISTRLGLTAGLLIGCGTGAVLSADLPVKAVPMAPAFYNWSGIYVGAHAGYGMGMKDWITNSFDYDVRGFLGGGQIGINQQIGNWVIGIEADASWAGINGSQTLTLGGPLLGLLISSSATTNVDRIATVAGRLGLAQDRWLVYLKGGAAWVHENHAITGLQTLTVPGAAAVTATLAATGSENRLGPMIGFGAEHALWGNWSFKSEYNFIYMPTGTARIAGTVTAGGLVVPLTSDENIRQVFHLAKFGVNYRFGPEAPPAIAPVRPAPGYNWTGFYIGAQAAYGFGRKLWENYEPNGGFNVSGALAGVVTGTNVQVGAFVFGAESEWMWSGMRGATRFTNTPGFGFTSTFDLSTRIDWLSLNSLRAGFVAADRWLVYFKGGVALAQESHAATQTQVLPGVGSASQTASGRALHTGLLAGVGLEYAFLGNWSAKLEYNYIHFRPQEVTGTGNAVFNAPPLLVGTIAAFQRDIVNQQIHLVKFGVSYKFTGGLSDVVTARF